MVGLVSDPWKIMVVYHVKKVLASLKIKLEGTV